MLPNYLTALRVRTRAMEATTLPTLPTIAFRSVLGMKLRELSCVAPDSDGCVGCEAASSCAYGVLFEPKGTRLAGHGVTDRAPPPLVLAPETPVPRSGPMHLQKGQEVDVRVVLIGPGRAHADLIIAALRRGADGGVGRRRQDGWRPAMTVVDVKAEPVMAAAPGPSALVELISPLRLTYEGKVRARFGAREFLLGLARRADTLHRLYGGSSLGSPPPTDDVTLEARDSRVIDIARWSSRQNARMDLPGVLGLFVLSGSVSPWWPWLALGEWVQVGKGTSMGFGRYRLRAVV